MMDQTKCAGLLFLYNRERGRMKLYKRFVREWAGYPTAWRLFKYLLLNDKRVISRRFKIVVSGGSDRTCETYVESVCKAVD
jgi:hypothetical protein